MTDTEIAQIHSYLQRHCALHAYEMGDLDEAFLPLARLYRFPEDGPVEAVAVCYTGGDPHTLLCLCLPDELDRAYALLERIDAGLPDTLNAHLSVGLSDALSHEVIERIDCTKMALTDAIAIAPPTAAIAWLGPEHAEELSEFYAESYPDNWFDPRMLTIRPFAALREGGRLLAVAGLHVFSERYEVAALGNIAVHPDARGRGLGAVVTAALCRDLAKNVSTIALNVHTDNVAARSCYRRVGFTEIARYEELKLARSA